MPSKIILTEGSNERRTAANIYRNRVCGGAPRHAAFTPTMTDQHRRTDFFGKLEVK
ncbi:MAG: hypothetical protein J5654_01105 [Victivallales bacterium]|nr:hypothetical protein [Victivallales bacterium]